MMLAIKRSHLLIAVAWSVHAISWFLPAVRGIAGGQIDSGIPGWAAFVIASCALRPCTDNQFDSWYNAALSAISVITTVLFVFISPWAALRGSRLVRHACAWVAAAAFAVNTHWFILWGSGRSDLGVGYYLWLLSFGLLSAGVFDLSRRIGHHESTAQPTLSHS